MQYCRPTIKGLPCDSDGKESAYNVGDLSSIPGFGRSLGEGNGKPLQYSLPGKSHGWRSLAAYTVHRVTKSWTRLSDFTFFFSSFKVMAGDTRAVAVEKVKEIRFLASLEKYFDLLAYESRYIKKEEL